jgi:hypothetical protein
MTGEELTDLQDRVLRLHRVLQDWEPGLATWQAAVNDCWRDVVLWAPDAAVKVASKAVRDRVKAVWFIGPVSGPGYVLLVSDGENLEPHRPPRGDSYHKPPEFPGRSLDTKWSAEGRPQGTARVDTLDGWTVLSVADYTEDSRPNVMAIFTIHGMATVDDMLDLAAARFPRIYARLGVKR